MKVAIIRPLFDRDELEFQEPCGAQAICGFIKANGYNCRVFDRRIGATVTDIERYDPACVGFSVMTDGDLPDALKLLLELKNGKRRFFAGGLFITTNPDKARALFPSDTLLISGEGELPAVNYLRGLEDKPPLQKEYLHPNEWAFQSRESIRVYIERGGVMNIRSARGCRGNCTFCTTPGLAPELRRFQARDISLVVDEIEASLPLLYEPIVNFTDDEFGDVSRIYELTEELKKRDMNVAFSLELRALAMLKANAQDWEKLHKGGLCRVFTGLESVNKDTLKKWKKPINPEAVIESVVKCQSAGIVCEVGYILWHPDQTVDGALREIDRLHQHGLFSPKVALSRLILLPGSELHSAYGKAGDYPAALSDRSEAYYNRITELLSSLAELRNKCAVALPNAACTAFLSGDSRRKDRLIRLMKEINDLSYEAIMNMRSPEIDKITKLRSEADEICRSGQLVK